MLKLFVTIAPEGIPHLQQAALDIRVLIFTLTVSLVSGILFGLAPALHRPSGEQLTGKVSRATTHHFLRQTFVTAQIALSLVLLAGAGLLLRSLWKLQNVPLGMDTQSILVAQITLPEYRYPQSAQQLAFFRELELRLARFPGVAALG